MQSSYHSFENSKCKYGNTSDCYKTFHVQQKTRYVRRIINSHYSKSQVFFTEDSDSESQMSQLTAILDCILVVKFFFCSSERNIFHDLKTW